jgi:choline dehydrogenase-like flavoprotein
VKRRTILAGLIGGSGVATSGLTYRQWLKRNDINNQTLTEFSPSANYDVCIVGTGPAGCTLARQLSDAGLRVLLLESGSALSDSAGMQGSAKLDSYSVSGLIEYPLQGSRMRALGGTSNVWTGRCPRLLPSDFVNNPLAPKGRWPVTYAEMQPYYRAAEQTLSVIGDELTASHAPRQKNLPGPSLHSVGELRNLLLPLDITVDYPPVSHQRRWFDNDGPMRFALDVLPSLSRENNVDLITKATATEIVTDNNGSVSGIRMQSIDGTNKSAKAKVFIVAGGAVESIRLLMLSKSQVFPDGIGNHANHLGRYFMEHPFKSYSADIPGLQPISRWLLGRTYQYCQPLKEQGLGGVLLGFYMSPKESGRFRIALGIEMAPDKSNQVSLNTNKSDALANPSANLHLNFSEQDQRLWRAGEEIVFDIFKRLGSDEIRKRDSLHWSHHHMGGTRMSELAGDGVVDKNLRVHGTDNLYVLSSSVFVTSGVANPTLTITALAHRLARHIATLL